MRQIIKILILLLLILSCKKGKGEFILKGSVQDNTFNTSLSGATVKLFQVPIGTTDMILIGTTTISSDGNYEFSFSREKMERYVIRVTRQNYFQIEEDIYFSSLSLENENIRNYSTTAKSWVKLRFVNLSPSASDVLGYIKQDGKQDCAECCSKDQQYLYGVIDTAIFCINDANTPYSYFYYVSGTSNNGIKSVITTAFDTTELLLQY